MVVRRGCQGSCVRMPKPKVRGEEGREKEVAKRRSCAVRGNDLRV